MARGRGRIRDPLPQRPVEKIEVSSRHVKPRAIAAVVCLLVGVAALVYAFVRLLSADAGWQEVETNTGGELNCGDDFVLLYEIGAGDASAAAESRALRSLYTDACEKAYQLFTDDVTYDGVHNVRYLNLHPNETVEVDPVLYDAFAKVEDAGSRSIYLAPVHELYDGIFACTDDAQLIDYDPATNDDIQAFYSEICAFANDPSSVEIRLLGDNRLELFVSDEYLTYAAEQDITSLVDFSYLKNAFITDFLAQTLEDAGYTHGALSSYDGFVRCLDARPDASYSLSLYDWVGGAAYGVASVDYEGVCSFVTMRAFPANSRDSLRIYVCADNTTRTEYLDPADAFSKSATPSLTAYSSDATCAAIALSMEPVYVADALSQDALGDLLEDGIYSIYCEDQTIYYNDQNLNLSALYQGADMTYTATLVEP